MYDWSSNKTLLVAGSLVLTASVCTAAYLSNLLIMAAPFLLLAILFFLRYPCLLFYTLMASIPWSVEVNFTESLGTDLPDEPLMLGMSFIVISLLLVQKRKKDANKKQHLLLALLFLSTAWLLLTVLFSSYFSLSVKYFLAKAWYLLSFVGAPLVLYRDEKLVKNAAIILFVSMFLVTCIGLWKHATLGFTFATVNDAITPFFRNHVNYSALLVFMVPLLLAFYTLVQNRNYRVCLLTMLLILVAALYFSYARGAWLALMAGVFAYWLIKRRWLLHGFLLFIVLSAGSIFWLQHNDRYLAFAPKHDVTVFHENFNEHLVATYKGRDVSTAERFYRWVAGARMGTDAGLTGFGPTTFYHHYRSYTIPLFRTWVSGNKEKSTVHNYFLLLFIEQGILGLLLFLLLLGTMFWYAQKIYNRPSSRFWKTTAATIAAILWMQIILNSLSDLIETDKVGSVFYLCVAFLIIADVKTRERTA